MEKAVPLLMVAGFTVHLVNLAHYLQYGQAEIKGVLLPAVDAVLAVWMTYCAIGLIFGFKRFFERFALRGLWRRAAYWAITFYVTASLPGHIRFLAFGDTSYFDTFPWWFSPIIMTVYALIIIYFQTLTEAPSQLTPHTVPNELTPMLPARSA
jgi:hypothetical protein